MPQKKLKHTRETVMPNDTYHMKTQRILPHASKQCRPDVFSIAAITSQNPKVMTHVKGSLNLKWRDPESMPSAAKKVLESHNRKSSELSLGSLFMCPFDSLMMFEGLVLRRLSQSALRTRDT